VLIVQSARFDGYRRRVVVPLVSAETAGVSPSPAFNPAFHILGTAVILHTLDLASVPLAALGPKVASLADEGDRILAALDELYSRALG
jgi:toxin CcdB